MVFLRNPTKMATLIFSTPTLLSTPPSLVLITSASSPRMNQPHPPHRHDGLPRPNWHSPLYQLGVKPWPQRRYQLCHPLLSWSSMVRMYLFSIASKKSLLVLKARTSLFIFINGVLLIRCCWNSENGMILFVVLLNILMDLFEIKSMVQATRCRWFRYRFVGRETWKKHCLPFSIET